MKKPANLLWGIAFIVLGLILGGNALGITNIDIFFNGWWTLFIIVPCFIGLFGENDKTGDIVGLFIGIILLLCCQNVLDFEMIWKLIVPVILVIVGISFICKDSIRDKVSKEIRTLNQTKTDENNFCSTFAGQNINFDNQEFKGADLTAVFGGVKCDLRKATITKDVLINASSTFGGIEIFVPENVQVKIKCLPIFGGVTDKSKKATGEDIHTIYINAQCVFGGVD